MNDHGPTTTETEEFTAYNGFGVLRTTDIDEAISYAKTGAPDGYVEKVTTVKTTTVVYHE